MMKKNLTKRSICIGMILCMLLSYIPIVNAEPSYSYEDVKDYYPYNSWAVDTGKKYSLVFLEDNRRESKRWEIVNILYNIAELEAKNRAPQSFNDLNDVGDEIKKRIEIVSSNEIVLGYEDGSFKPFNNVTRAEFVTMLDRTNILEKITNVSDVTNFNDIDNHWAKSSINKVTKAGIITGRGDNNFCPEDNITPQEILIILDRLVTEDYITSDTLLRALLDTFKCKKYGEEEKYIVEVIYSKFDEVQNDIKFYWPLNDLYDSSIWQGQATYRDLAYAIYFYWGYGINYSEYVEKEKSRMDYIKSVVLEAQGLDPNIEGNLDREFTMRNLIYAMAYHKNTEYETVYGGSSTEISFSNLNAMSSKEQVALSLFSEPMPPIGSNETYELYNIIENTDNIFPLDAPITRYMLNYYITRMYIYNDPYFSIVTKATREFFNIDTFYVETDISKMPANYYDYPFIIKGIPKEYYEMPFIPNSENDYVYKPKECFPTHGRYYYRMQEEITKLYNTILNVDYTTINEDKFYEDIKYSFVFPSKEEKEIRDYVRYVIDNQIVLKGQASVIPGTTSIKEYGLPGSGGFPYIRICVKFEIVSSNTNENLILGDCNNSTNVKYNKKSYTLCFDKELGALIGGGYRITFAPLVREVYFKNDSINEL